jgi:ribosome maturation factor RimP
MQVEASLEKFRSLAREITAREGCLLYDVEFGASQQGRVLRVFIDREQGTVSLEDCANVSRGLNSILDVDEELIPGGAYELEVSSPGIERRLSEGWHFTKALGQPVRIKTLQPVNGGLSDVTPQTLLDGVLKNFENETLTIRKDERDWLVARAEVSKAQVRFVVPENHPKGKKKR